MLLCYLSLAYFDFHRCIVSSSTAAVMSITRSVGHLSIYPSGWLLISATITIYEK